MPEINDLNIPLSQQITNARTLLLETLQNQLETPITDRLNPQDEGVPFVNVDKEPPQISAIKKVLNSLYHAEESLKIWESMDTSTLWAKAKAAPQGVRALTQIYKSLALLNDATPEIQSLIVENYHLLEPVFTGTYEVIKSSGWVSEFSEMEVTDQASTVITQGINLLGPDLSKWNTTNPLVDSFSKISELMNIVSAAQSKQLTEKEMQERSKKVIELLQDLEGNAFIRKITVRSLEESKAVNDLFDWFKNIQEDDFEFTKDSIQRYITWANRYLPQLILSIDQFERQNYLKSGLLSKALCVSSDQLANTMNEQLAASSLTITDQIVMTSSLAQEREQKIETSQIESVYALKDALAHRRAAVKFFTLLEEYNVKAFSDITEPERVVLRQLYPDLQLALAHANLALENRLTAILNTVGPEEVAEEAPVTKSWWEMAVGGISGAVNFVGRLVVSGDVDSTLATEDKVYQFFDKKIQSEQLKITAAEVARDQLGLTAENLSDLSLEARVNERTRILSEKVLVPGERAEIRPGDLVPVNASSLNNFRGNFTYLQELHLSATVNATRKNVEILIDRHLSESNKVFFSTPPYIINVDEPDLVVQIKKIENSLFHLEQTLVSFEEISNDMGIVSKAKLFIFIASAGLELKRTVTALSPEARKTLAPVLQQVMAFSSSLSGIDYRSGDLSVLGRLYQTTNTLPEQLEEGQVATVSASTTKVKQTKAARLKQKEKVISLIKEDYAEQIATARNSLISKFIMTLASPLARNLTPREKGAPFINFDEDPPQLAAIKKVINSMYYAESAIRINRRMNCETSSALDKIVLAHQGIVALSQVYKSLALIGDASPEIREIIQNNYDLIDPMIKGTNQLIKSTGWSTQLNALVLTKTAGSLLGQGLNLAQPGTVEPSQSYGIVKLLSQLPLVMSTVSKRLDSSVTVNDSDVKVTEIQIDAISALAELFIEHNGSTFHYLSGPYAIISLIDLNKKLNLEGNRLQNITIEAYQQWLERDYPKLLAMIDTIEIRNYLKPGILSASLIVEIDNINIKLNEIIESRPETNLKRINVSTDLVESRIQNLQDIKADIWMEMFQNEEQQKSARDFFKILKKYSDKSLLDMKPSVLAQVRLAFAKIQVPMSHVNLELSNEIVNTLNVLERTRRRDKKPAVNLTINQLLQQEPLIQKYLKQQYKTFVLNVEVINEVRAQWSSIANQKEIDQEEKKSLRQHFKSNQIAVSLPGPGALQLAQPSSINTARGNFSIIQDLQLSSYIGLLSERVKSITKDKMSERVQSYLVKADDQKLHVINESDPSMPRQMKQIANGLYHLETALRRFEQLNKNDSVLSQIQIFIEIENEIRQLKAILDNIAPEVKAHYGPLINQLLVLTDMIKKIEYNQKDTEELQAVLLSAKKELLTPNQPGVADKSADPKDHPSKAKETAARGLKLGVKYLHSVSPSLERARAYILARYGKKFEDQPSEFRSFTREQLSSEHFMANEAKRLDKLLDGALLLHTKKPKIAFDLTKQLLRVGAQAGELAGMVNTLVSDEYLNIKKEAYQSYIFALSQEEDYLCLKPGTLVNQGMVLMNQLFLSVALELEMPFKQKVALLNDAYFINILIKQTKIDLALLEKKLKLDPLNKDVQFNIDIKKDKLVYLKQQIDLYRSQDIKGIKSALLDIQFEIDLRDTLRKSYLNNPILHQYENALRTLYTDNKLTLLNAQDSGVDLVDLLLDFEKNKIGHYIIADKAIHKLSEFGEELPDSNQIVKDYLIQLTSELANEEIPIEQRTERIKLLPFDSMFVNTVSTAFEGLGFLQEFKLFVERISKSIVEGFTTGANIIATYYQLKLEQKMEVIDKHIHLNNEPSLLVEDGKFAEVDMEKYVEEVLDENSEDDIDEDVEEAANSSAMRPK